MTTTKKQPWGEHHADEVGMRKYCFSSLWDRKEPICLPAPVFHDVLAATRTIGTAAMNI